MLRRQLYRVYFRNDQGRIEACENFIADSDRSALSIALHLFNACSDCCFAYELWRGKGRLETEASVAGQLTPEMQTALLAAAEGLLQTKWQIAKSERLLNCARRWREVQQDDWAAAIVLAAP